jgi:hypothetical protein
VRNRGSVARRVAGLVVSAVLKFCDNIARVYAHSIAMVSTLLLSAALFRLRVTTQLVIALLLVVISTLQCAAPAPRPASPPPPASRAPPHCHPCRATPSALRRRRYNVPRAFAEAFDGVAEDAPPPAAAAAPSESTRLLSAPAQKPEAAARSRTSAGGV